MGLKISLGFYNHVEFGFENLFGFFNHFEFGFKNLFGFFNYFEFGFKNGFGFLNYFDFGFKNGFGFFNHLSLGFLILGFFNHHPFDTTHDILRSLSVVQSLLKARNSPNWRQRAPTHMNLSGTEELRISGICGKPRKSCITDLKTFPGWRKSRNNNIHSTKNKV